MIMLLRFRELPDAQTKYIEELLEKPGKTIIGSKDFDAFICRYQKTKPSPSCPNWTDWERSRLEKRLWQADLLVMKLGSIIMASMPKKVQDH